MARNSRTGLSSNALVFFGATGDLAHKKIFPALYEMTKRGALNVPVVGVAHSNWGLAQLRNRARDSIEHTTGGIDDRRAFDHLLSGLRYVDGDYEDADTFTRLIYLLWGQNRPEIDLDGETGARLSGIDRCL